MNTNLFKLAIKEIDGVKVIDFANNSDKFVEVVFTIDNKDVKFGFEYRPELKGYAYPPKLEKEVKKMKDGSLLPFRWLRSGEVKAYIFRGNGSYHDRDIDKPTFLRHRLVKSIRFKRTDTQPHEILAIKY